MNEGINKDKLDKKLQELGIESDGSNYLFCMIKRQTFLNILLLGKLAQKNSIAIFSEKQITILYLTLTGNFTDKCVVIPRHKISNLQFSDGIFLSASLHLHSQDEDYVMEVPKKVLSAAWQSDNYAHLVKHNFFFDNKTTA